ncbi:MAG: type II toxin-antitoxin system VapC family toxin [Gammaproteobacteria bacterium]|nr:MAG: type II toxin-antitoxin system VapC family toxin [Gammaproteobacteria bacterium]
MKYILDTDTIIYFLKGEEDIVDRIANISPDKITTTIISHTELLFGAFNSAKKKQNLEKIQAFLDKIQIIPFCKESSTIFAEQKTLLKKQGNIIADLDLIIASISIRHHSTLVTNNVKHFIRLKKLKIENWKTTCS